MKKLLLVAMVMILMAGVAFADASVPKNLSVNLVGGTLAISASNEFAFPVVNLTGNEIDGTAATAIPTFDMNDATGTGAGWSVTFACPNLELGGNANGNARKELSILYANATTKALKVIQGTAPNATDGPALLTASGALSATPKTVMGVHTADFGMGEYQSVDGNNVMVPAMFSFNIVPDQYAGVYTGQLTAAIATGTITFP